MTPLKVIKAVTVTPAMLTATSVPENDYSVWAAGTTYALDARVILTSTHKVYQSVQAGNVGHDPATSQTWWVEVSPTNRWKLFDLSNTTQTVVDASDYYEITPGTAVNSVALLNIQGLLTIRVRLTDPSFGVVYDQTADLRDIPSASSWYTWFFEERTAQTQFLVTDLPTYPNATMRVDVTTSGTGYVGVMTMGSQRSIGSAVQQGVRLGIQDYSRKERNDWGDTVLVQRAFAKRASFNLFLENKDLDNAYRLLADLRATPCVWIGSTEFSSLVVFGFYQNFDINISYANYSDCTLDIEGLT